MHQIIKGYWLLLLLLISFSAEASHHCSQWLAKVISFQGKVDIQFSESSDWESVTQDQTFCHGDKIRTAKNSRATLLFTNESRATLDQNSTLILLAPEKKVTSWYLELLKGSSFFRSRESQRLNIHTPFINAVHEGTEFLIAVNSEQTEITVFDGQVAASNQEGEIQIKKGYTGIANKSQPPRIQALTIRPEDAVQWTLYYPPVIDYQDSDLSKSDLLKPAIKAYQQGDIYQALNLLDKIPASQQNADYLTLKSSLLLTVGSVDEALTDNNKALLLEPNSSAAFALLSVIAVTKNRQQKAFDLAQKAVASNPQSAVAQIALSYAYQSQFKIESALKATEQATRLSPENALAWARLSELQLSTGERSDALASAKKAQQLNPKLERSQTILGFAYLAQVDIDEANTAFEEAINLNSADPLARLGLGLAKIRKGDIEEGARDLETAVSLDPNISLTRSYLGKAKYQLKNFDFASTELLLAKQIDPNDPTPWAYDAILKQAINQPIEALYDIQEAIKLNDNRAIYRSRLLLDEDYSIRGTSLARIYDDLGFEHIATLEASKSITLYPSNHSAHRFLSDSYATQPRFEIARASELLQSQLLQPVNLNPVQPQIAIDDLNIVNGIGPAENSFNEFNRVFEGNSNQFAATGIFGNNHTYGDEAVLSGIYDKLSYSLGQLFYTSDGFRENNDLHHNVYNVFTQYAFSPKFNVQAEYRYRKTRQGDLELTGSPTNFSDNERRKLEQNTYRLGFRLSPAQKSDFLVSAIYATRKETFEETQIPAPGRLFDIENNGNQDGYQLEVQYLLHHNNFNVITGGGAYLYDVTQQLIINGNPQPEDNFRRDQYFGYLYSDINFLKNITATLGLSFDSYNESKRNGLKVEAFNPKIGLRWLINDNFTMRLAAFRTVKSSIVVNQRVEPTQVAGFNQSYDDVNGTLAMQYSFGLDAKFSNSFFSGLEFFYRDLDAPVLINDNFENRNNNEHLYRVYLNWVPHINWAFNSEFRYEKYKGDRDDPYDRVETAYLPLSINYYHSIGAFAELGGTYVYQNVETNSKSEESFSSDFFLLDAAVGYRFPKQYGLISFEAKNLLNTQFKFRSPDFRTNEIRASEITPELTFMARITFNFSL